MGFHPVLCPFRVDVRPSTAAREKQGVRTAEPDQDDLV